MVPDDFNFKINNIITTEYSSGYGKWFDMNYLQFRDPDSVWSILSFGCVLKTNKSINGVYIHETKKEIDGIRLSF